MESSGSSRSTDSLVREGDVRLEEASELSDKAVEGKETKGLKGSGSDPLNTALSDRSISQFVPTSFVNRLYNALESTALFEVSKAFLADFVSTTANTFIGMYTNLDKGISEGVRFTAGLAGASAALLQTAAALAADKVAEAGYSVSDDWVDGITPLLKAAGVEATNISREDIVQLASSFVALQLGMTRDISVKGGQFSFKLPGMNTKISDIQLDRIRTCSGELSDKPVGQLGLQADQLKFSLQLDNGRGSPSRVNVCIPDIKFESNTNLLSLVGESVARCCKNMPLLMTESPSGSELMTGVENEIGGLIADEVSSTSFDAKSIIINVENLGAVLADYGFSHDTKIICSDVSLASKKHLLQNAQAEKPKLKLNLIDIGDLQTSPIQLKHGYLRLDDNLNGELVFTLLSDFEAMKEYCPTWLPKKLRNGNGVGGNDQSRNHYASIRLGVDVSEGIIDLNTLKTSSFDKQGIGVIQRVIVDRLESTLRSKHTRLKRRNNKNELKIYVPLLTEKGSEVKVATKPMTGAKLVTDLLKKAGKKWNPPIHKSYVKLPESSGFITENKGRGKISLLQLLENSVGVSLSENKPRGKIK